MDLNLKGKIALITGASRGIGRAVAEALGAEGCDLVLTSRTARDLDAVKASIEKQNKVTVRTVAADLSDSVTVGRLTNDFPAIDILINNAGAIPGGQLAEIDETRWRVAWDLKVFGTINMTRGFYPLIKARGGGVIINVIGNAALTRDPEYICGATANAGLTAFTESLAARACVTASASMRSAQGRPRPTDWSDSRAGRRRSGSAIPSAGRSCSPPCLAAASASRPRSHRWLRSSRRRNPATPAEQ